MDETLAPSYSLYQQLLRDTQIILKDKPRSHAAFDFNRIKDARQAYLTWKNNGKVTPSQVKSFINQAILPVHGLEFTQSEFDHLKQIYGDSVVQVAMIDGNLQKWFSEHKENEQILGTGGACALESIDTRHIEYLRRNNVSPEKITEYVHGIMSHFPTWTQITGALIPINGVSVMYDETFPWFLKIKEFGIPDAESFTQRVYDEIFEHVIRFAKLHNPKNTVVRVPFDELNLVDGGQLQSWFDDYRNYIYELEDSLMIPRSEYNPAEYYKSWVEYTYSGPEILQIVLNLIKKTNPSLFENYHLDTCSIHVRGKQIDHFDVERHNLWIHQALLSKPFQKSKTFIQLMQTPTHRHAMAKYFWMRDHLTDIKSIGSAGMLDFNMMGELAHEMSLVSKTSSVHDHLIENLLDSPLRLHSQNVDEVIHFLERFRNPYAISFSKQALVTLTNLNASLTKMNKKLEILNKYTTYSDYFLKIFKSTDASLIKTDLPTAEFNEMLSFLIERYKGYNHLLQAIIQQNPTLDKKNINLENALKHIISISTSRGKTVITIENRELLSMWISLMEKYNQNDRNRIEAYQVERDKIQDKLNESAKSISENVIKSKSFPMMDYVTILPLVDNVFVSYMQQLLFIPSIQQAYMDIVSVSKSSEYSREAKEQMIVAIIDSIFEIVTSCICYVMKKECSYPWQARFEARYVRPY